MDFFKNNKEKLITFIVCGTIFVAVLSVIALLSGVVMRLFGFRYQSIWSIILFFIIATVVSYPINLIAGGLPKALYKLKRISKKYCNYFIFSIRYDCDMFWIVNCGLLHVNNCCKWSIKTSHFFYISFAGHWWF